MRTGDKIEIRGFGSFRTRQRQPRIGRNPKTGARVEVPAKKIPYFKPSKELKDVVNNSAVPGCRAARSRMRRRAGDGRAHATTRLSHSGQHGLSLDAVALPVRHPSRDDAGGVRLLRRGAVADDAKTLVVHRGAAQFRHPQSLSRTAADM